MASNRYNTSSAPSSSKPYPMRQPVDTPRSSSRSPSLQRQIDLTVVTGTGADVVPPLSPHLQEAIDQSIASTPLQQGQTTK